MLMSKKAVVLLSGGLDSATTLAIARDEGYACYALSIDYGQRHLTELVASQKVVKALGAELHRTLTVDLAAFGGSALTDPALEVPMVASDAIPLTYVPARNTIMLSLALAWAEVLEARDIFIGVNAVDYSGYPDCRPEFIEACERTANLATKAGVEGHRMTIHAPLIHLKKSEIIQKGVALGVDYGLTVSCYQADEQGRACGQCDSCRLRRQGFREAGIADPTVYVS